MVTNNVMKQESETKAILAKNSNSIETMESSNSDSLTSLSEQVAILEERLADCKYRLLYSWANWADLKFVVKLIGTCTSTRP